MRTRRLVVAWQICVGAAPIVWGSLAGADVTPPAVADVKEAPAPPQPPGRWMLDDSLLAHEVASPPERHAPRLSGGEARVSPPRARTLMPAMAVKRDEPRTDGEGAQRVLDFVDDTLGLEELALGVEGRTVVKRVTPPARKPRRR